MRDSTAEYKIKQKNLELSRTPTQKMALEIKKLNRQLDDLTATIQELNDSNSDRHFRSKL